MEQIPFSEHMYDYNSICSLKELTQARSFPILITAQEHIFFNIVIC